MNPRDLKNNALFLSCWYERSRPVQMICFGILIFSILLLSFSSVSLNETKPEIIQKSLFYVMVGISAVVLLLQGTMFAGHMGARERTSETLDFHRNSPQPVGAKVIGLIFGSTWFEWAVFFILFILELPFALLPGIRVTQIILFNVSLMLSGIFFHTSAVAIALLSTQKKRGSSLLAFGLLIFIFFGGPFFFYYLTTSSPALFSYLFGVIAFQYMAPDQFSHFNGRFYTLELPLMIIYVGMGGLFSLPYLTAIKCPVFNGSAYFLMLSSYVVAFAGFLEFFRLSRFRNNKIFLVTVMLVGWIFMPWVVILTLHLNLNDQIFAASISPFFGLSYAVSLLLGERPVELSALITPCVVAGVMWLLAWQEHTALEKDVTG